MMFLIITGLVIYFLLTLYRPHWGIYIILLLLPSYQIRFQVFGIPSTFLEWLILILALSVFIKMLLGNHERISHASLKTLPKTHRNPNPVQDKRLRKIFQNFPALTIAISVFLIASIIAIFVSPQTLKALGLFKAYIAEGILFWFLFVLLIDTREKLFSSIKALGALIVYLAIFGLFQFFTLYRLPPSWWGPGTEPRRVVSLFTYPNAVSLLITPILALYSALLIFYKDRSSYRKEQQTILLSRSFLIWVNILGITLLILTFSRGALLGYIVAILLLLFFSQFKKAAFALFTVGVILMLVIPATRNRITPIFAGTDPASYERIKLYKGSFEIIKQSPVLGTGLYGFRDAYEELRGSNADEILNYPHNFFLNFWIETGIFGLVAILAMLVWTLRAGSRLYDQNQELRPMILAVFASLVVILVHGQVDVPFFKNDLAILFWFLLAMIPVLKLYNLETKEKS